MEKHLEFISWLEFLIETQEISSCQSDTIAIINEKLILHSGMFFFQSCMHQQLLSTRIQ